MENLWRDQGFDDGTVEVLLEANQEEVRIEETAQIESIREELQGEVEEKSDDRLANHLGSDVDRINMAEDIRQREEKRESIHMSANHQENECIREEREQRPHRFDVILQILNLLSVKEKEKIEC